MTRRGWIPVLWMVVFFLVMPLELPASEKEEEIEGEHHHRHRIELFLGNTYEEGENDFGIGLAYEYRLSQLLGIGGFFEFFLPIDRDKLGAELFFHPYMGFRFVVGGGSKHDREEDELDPFFRLGAAYEFELDRWSFIPEFNVDFSGGERGYVFGVSVGYSL